MSELPCSEETPVAKQERGGWRCAIALTAVIGAFHAEHQQVCAQSHLKPLTAERREKLIRDLDGEFEEREAASKELGLHDQEPETALAIHRYGYETKKKEGQYDEPFSRAKELDRRSQEKLVGKYWKEPEVPVPLFSPHPWAILPPGVMPAEWEGDSETFLKEAFARVKGIDVSKNRNLQPLAIAASDKFSHDFSKYARLDALKSGNVEERMKFWAEQRSLIMADWQTREVMCQPENFLAVVGRGFQRFMLAPLPFVIVPKK